MTEGISDYPERIVLAAPDNPVELRQLMPDDAAAYFGLVDYDRLHLSQFGEPTAEKYPSSEAVLDSIVNPRDPAKYRFGMWVDDVMVGSNNILPQSDGVAEIGSWVGKQYAGHNYAADARLLLVGFAFQKLGVRKVLSMVHANNQASRKSVERSGFVLQAIHGDVVVYALNNPAQATQ